MIHLGGLLIFCANEKHKKKRRIGNEAYLIIAENVNWLMLLHQCMIDRCCFFLLCKKKQCKISLTQYGLEKKPEQERQPTHLLTITKKTKRTQEMLIRFVLLELESQQSLFLPMIIITQIESNLV